MPAALGRRVTRTAPGRFRWQVSSPSDRPEQSQVLWRRVAPDDLLAGDHSHVLCHVASPLGAPFVYANFNRAEKFGWETLRAWSSILKRNSGAVLWLRERPQSAQYIGGILQGAFLPAEMLPPRHQTPTILCAWNPQNLE